MTSKVGDLIYPVYTPARVDVVTKVDTSKSRFMPTYTLQHPLGDTADAGHTSTTTCARSFDDLVDEHKRKYEKHKATQERLRNLRDALKLPYETERA